MVRRASGIRSLTIVGIATVLFAGCHFSAAMIDSTNMVNSTAMGTSTWKQLYSADTGFEAAISLRSHGRYSRDLAAGDSSLLVRVSIEKFNANEAPLGAQKDLSLTGVWLQGHTSFNAFSSTKTSEGSARPFIRYGGGIVTFKDNEDWKGGRSLAWQMDLGLEFSILEILCIQASIGTQTIDVPLPQTQNEGTDLVTTPIKVGVSLYF